MPHRPAAVLAEILADFTRDLPATLTRAVLTSAAASAASAAALMLLGAREGRGALSPLNASSHWLYGDRAARREPSLARTGVGLLTHHAATLFWSVILEKALGPRKRSVPELAVMGAVTSGLAAAVDYLLVPRRLSPGWELALTRKSMAGAFAAMAAGLTAGALASRAATSALSQRARRTRRHRA
jgi:hypothetical protein